jgi:hypothetical protein
LAANGSVVHPLNAHRELPVAKPFSTHKIDESLADDEDDDLL